MNPLSFVDAEETEMKVGRETTPDVRIGGLGLWFDGRQFPDSTDYWDGNWLLTRAECEAPGSRISVFGSFLHTSELQRWLDSAQCLVDTLDGESLLDTMEPNLKVRMTGNGRGQVRIEVQITPDHLTQRHYIEFDLDQTYILRLTTELRQVLRRFPIRGDCTTAT